MDTYAENFKLSHDSTFIWQSAGKPEQQKFQPCDLNQYQCRSIQIRLVKVFVKGSTGISVDFCIK